MILMVPVKGYFDENSYLYIDDDSKHGFLIDPGAEAERLLQVIDHYQFFIEKILLTHGHFDHIGAVQEISEKLHIPVYAHERAGEYLNNAYYNLSSLCGPSITVNDWHPFKDNDVISLKDSPSFSLRVIYTPGHTTDSVIFYSPKDHSAFVGDTIFKGSIGNDRYPGGNGKQLIDSIINRIFTLPADTVLYSGHSEPTTVEEERARYL